MFGIGSIFFTVAKWLLGADGIIGKGFDLAAKKADVAHLDLATLSAEKRAVLIEAIKGDTTRTQVQGGLVMAAMSHKVWWWAWGLFVFPVGLYHATIFMLSTFGIGPETFAVLKVPPDQGEWARDIIKTIFIAQAGTGVAAMAAQSITSIFKK
jgi:hypothetical protein